MQGENKRFKEIWHRIDIHYNRYAKKVGLNFTAMLVLECLVEAPEFFTQKALCEKLVLPKQFINTIITSFWEQGYVELKEAKDRRNKKIHLTEKGKAYAHSITKPLDDADQAVWADFSEEESEIFMRALEKYEQAMARVVG